MLTAFGDESSDEDKKRVFAVAALFGNQEQWDNLELKWQELAGGIEFHAADCDSDHGDFEKFSHGQNKKLYKDLTILLSQSGILGYGVAIDISASRQEVPNPLPEAEYYRCFAEVVMFFAERAYLSIPREPVKFIFDRRLESQYGAVSMYDYLVKLPEWKHREYLHEEIGFASRKAVGIQAADLWAREVMKDLDNDVGPVKRPRRGSLTTLAGTNRFGANLYTGNFFKGLHSAIQRAENETLTGAFKTGNYLKWLESNKLQDTYPHRVRFLAYFDALKRASGDMSHFDDVRDGFL